VLAQTTETAVLTYAPQLNVTYGLSAQEHHIPQRLKHIYKNEQQWMKETD